MREGAHSKPMDVKLNQSVMLKLSKLEANKGQIEYEVQGEKPCSPKASRKKVKVSELFAPTLDVLINMLCPRGWFL